MTGEEFLKLPGDDPRVQARMRLALRRLYRRDLSLLDDRELEDHFFLRDLFLSVLADGHGE